MRNGLISALDVGTTKICCFVARSDTRSDGQDDSEGQPDMAPLLADSIWVDCWPRETHTARQGVNDWKGWNDGGMGRVCVDRHNGRSIVAFNDGHVEAVELRNLWTLHWHKDWQTPNTLPSPKLMNTQ